MSLRKFLLAAGVAALAAVGLSSGAEAYQAVPIAAFNAPSDVRYLPSQPNNLYVVEQPGRIMLLRREVPVIRPFLDMQRLVQYSGERGLLSMAFAPDYATSFTFYVLFVNLAGDVEVDEFRSSALNLAVAALSTRRVVLRIPHPGAANHNGGQLQFGPDGYLYISVGDGGNTATPGDPARRLDTLLGKILRIDPHQDGTHPYRIPADNPFVGTAARPEIFAYGLRNPWRFSFNGTQMAIADVGQSRLEEVDMLPITKVRHSNFGWPQYEGVLLYDATKPGPGTPVFPMFTYQHTGDRCAIIGGMMVRDPQLPTLAGRYVYGDLCTGELRSFVPNVAAQTVSGDSGLGLSVPGITSFGVGRLGQIYMTDGSQLYRLEP